MVISALINNITLIIALSILYIFIIRRWKYGSRTSQAISGFLFGSVAVVGMMNPLIISPGLIFDGRSIIISVAGFIGGWVTALIAALMGIIYRTWIGGPGGIMGVSVIASSAAIGIAYHYIRRHKPHVVSPLYLIGFGIIVHICMLALTLTLPSGIRYEVFTNIAMPVILIYPIGTLLVCVVLLDLELRIKAEDALQDREARYRMLFEHSPDGIVIIDPATARPLEFNETAHRQLGYSREDFAALSIFDLEVDETQEETRSRITHVIQEGEADFETRQRTKQGEIRNVHVTAQIIEISGKQVYHCIWRDITKRERAEEALRESEERFRRIFEEAHLGIVITSPSFTFEKANPAFCRMMGYSADELRSMTFADITHPDHLKQDMENVKKVGRGELPFYQTEKRYINKSGKVLWGDLIVSSIHDKHGVLRYYLSLVNDITERKQAEEALRESEERFRMIASNTPDHILMQDRQLRYTFVVNPQLGLTEQDMIGKTDYDFLSKEEAERLTQVKTRVLESSNPFHFETSLISKAGEAEFFDGSFSPKFNTNGHVDGLIGYFRNVTKRKRTEEELQHTLESLRKAVGTTIQVMVSAVESRDPYTAGHQIRSADLARAIATEMGLPQDKIEGIRMAGSIHDIGKLSIPAEILSKPTKLSEIEFSLIKEHARKGYEMLKDVESPWPLAEIVYQHHERMDGSGYPRNLKGEEILIEARILAVSDVVEAMASHRPYRPGLGIDAALNEIEKNRGILYDSAVADACLRLFREKVFRLEWT